MWCSQALSLQKVQRPIGRKRFGEFEDLTQGQRGQIVVRKGASDHLDHLDLTTIDPESICELHHLPEQASGSSSNAILGDISSKVAKWVKYPKRYVHHILWMWSYLGKKGLCRYNQVEDLQIKSSWIRMGPKSSDKHPHFVKRKDKRKMHRED